MEKVIESNKTSAETRQKLQLIQRVKLFATERLKLTESENYETFVQLENDYVTWVVRAAPKYQLKPYTWWFPIVGSVPYKGYFTKAGAKDEAKVLKSDGYDTYVRGVSAYSTLGWFNDPVLSSMLRYKEYDLVNLIIHETVHATVFINGLIDFNERLATFIGNIGAEIYYSEQQAGQDVLKQIADENADQDVFSEFITHELKMLRQFYKDNEGQISDKQKQMRINEIQDKFKKETAPKLKTNSYSWFPKAKLNNAILLSLETYQADLKDFETVYLGLGKDFQSLLDYARELESEDNPEEALKAKANSYRDLGKGR